MYCTDMCCFILGATGSGYTEKGDAFLGSVSDDPYDVRTFLKAVKPKTGFSHIGTELISTTESTLEERGYFSSKGETTRGINEAGLAFTCSMIIEDPSIEKKEPTTPFIDITTEMLAKCSTVQEAIKLFQSQKAINPPYSLLLADAKGDLAHMEVGSFGIEIIDHFTKKNPGMVFAVNCYLSKTLVNYNAPHTSLDDPTNNNQARRERGKFLAESLKGKLSVENIAALLSDHKNSERDPKKNPILEGWGYSICNHGTRRSDTYPKEDLPWGTVSAEILEPKNRCFWYAYGWPCGQMPEYGDQHFQEKSWGKFEPFTLNPNELKKNISLLTTPMGEILDSPLRPHISLASLR